MPNNSPVLSFISDQIINEDESMSLALEATDVDLDDLTYSASLVSGDGSLTLEETDLAFTPSLDWFGSATIAVAVSDGSYIVEQLFTINVNAVNDAPTANAAVGETNEDESIVIVLSGDDVDEDTRDMAVGASGDGWYITFIGTGLSFLTSDHYAPMTFGGTDDYDFIIDGVTVKEWVSGQTMQKLQEVCQNLPYGTHIFQMKTNANAGAQYMRLFDVTFHQPKKPPVPEDACILADYMLMACLLYTSPSPRD